MNRREDASRRLGEPNHSEFGDEIVCSMPEETGNDESGAYNTQAESQGFLRDNAAAVTTAAAAFFATFIIAIIVSRMWDEDQIRLSVLDMLKRLLQTIARLCGSWALECERAYNDYANSLH